MRKAKTILTLERGAADPVDAFHPALVGHEFGVEGLVFLHLAAQVGGVSVRLVGGYLHLLCYPAQHLRTSGIEPRRYDQGG